MGLALINFSKKILILNPLCACWLPEEVMHKEINHYWNGFLLLWIIAFSETNQ